MTAHSLKEILARLPLLSKAELQHVRSRIDLLGGSRIDGPVAEVYQWLMHVLGGKGMPPLAVIMQSRQAKTFRHGSQTFVTFVDEVFGKTALRTRQRLYVLLLECIVSDVRESGQRVSPQTVAAALVNIWSVVERHFPGYMACGLLRDALADGGAGWDRSAG